MVLLYLLGFAVLFLAGSLALVWGAALLYGAATAMIVALVFGVLGVLAGCLIGASVAGVFRHPLQTQLDAAIEQVSRARREGRNPDYRYSSTRGASPYTRESDAPSYGDDVRPDVDPNPDMHWRPTAISGREAEPAGGASGSSPLPTWTRSADASSAHPTGGAWTPSTTTGSEATPGRTRTPIRKTRSGIARAGASLTDSLPVEQIQTRLQAGDLEGAVGLGHEAMQRELAERNLDELYAGLPQVLDAWRTGGGRAAIDAFGDQVKVLAGSSQGQTKEDAEVLAGVLDRIATLQPREIPAAAWMRILGGVPRARANPRAFLQLIAANLPTSKN